MSNETTTTAAPALSPEREREVNERLCRFLGEEYYVCDCPDSRTIGVNYCDAEHDYIVEPFTRSLDSLRLVEERLTEVQWSQYAHVLEAAINDMEKHFDFDWFIGGIVCALRLPVAVRAAALAEVVGE